MLTGNLNDLFDPVKKRILYSELNLSKLAQVLMKYQVSVCGNVEKCTQGGEGAKAEGRGGHNQEDPRGESLMMFSIYVPNE